MWRDAAYLLDMLAAARRAVSFIEAMTSAEFEKSDLHRAATIREIAVLGEAARSVSEETRREHPGIPWSDLVGMRNVLVHQYSTIDVATVWETVHDDLPALIAKLEKIVPREES